MRLFTGEGLENFCTSAALFATPFFRAIPCLTYNFQAEIAMFQGVFGAVKLFMSNGIAIAC